MVECSKYWLFYFYLGPLVLCLPGGLCRNASSPNPTLSLSPRFTVFHCGHVNTWHGQLHHVDPVDPQPHKKLPEVCELKGNILQRPTWSVFRSVWVWVPFCHCDIQHIIDLSLSVSLYVYIYIFPIPLRIISEVIDLGSSPPVQLHPQATETSQKAADPVLLGLVLYACQGWRSNHLWPLVSKLKWSWMV